MGESEKMVALKKAYAEIILNTAKEAAARVMASERRALRSQHDLNAAKDEALRLLLRSKKMIDAKETEAEINAISQRKRIEELEVQLQEAEDKILDLRMELRNVSDEVEKKKNEMQLFSGESAEEEAVDPKGEIPENHSNNLEPIVPYSSDSELETVAASVVINGAFSRRIQEHNFPDATKQTGQAAVSPLSNYFGRSSLASIMMRNAEPELCRNGCTQRIRAFERKHPDVTLGTGEVDNVCVSAMGGLKSKASERKGKKSTMTFPLASSLAARKKLLQDEIEKSTLHTRQRRKSQFVRSKSSSRRSYSPQLVRCSQSSFVADSYLANGNTQAGEAVPAELPSMVAKQDMQEDPALLQEKLHNNRNPFMESKVFKGKRKRKVVRRKSLATSLRSAAHCCRTNQVDANAKGDKVCVDVSKEEAEMGFLQCLDPLLLLSKSTEDFAAGVVDMPTTVKEQKLSNESQLVEQESDAVEVRYITISVLDAEEIDGPFRNSDLKEADVAHDGNGPTKDSRILKYTFHRKRKKELSNCPNEVSSPEKSNIKKLAMDAEDAAEGLKRSNVVNESSRDSRRLAQVARQLISLSGKRW